MSQKINYSVGAVLLNETTSEVTRFENQKVHEVAHAVTKKTTADSSANNDKMGELIEN